MPRNRWSALDDEQDTVDPRGARSILASVKVEAIEYGDRKVFSVGAFNRGVASWLQRLPTVWVEEDDVACRASATTTYCCRHRGGPVHLRGLSSTAVICGVDQGRVDDNGEHRPENLLTGPTLTFATDAARTNGVFVHASLWEASPLDESGTADGLGYNTAIWSTRGASWSAAPKPHFADAAGRTPWPLLADRAVAEPSAPAGDLVAVGR